jgi:two-component system, NarL family, nitrate/nitrite response regulator NarL
MPPAMLADVTRDAASAFPQAGPLGATALVSKIRVVVIDDHPMMRDGIAYTLGEEEDFEVAGVGACADDAIALADTATPDIMLVDINMPGGGLAVLQHLAARNPTIACVVITAKEDRETVGQALRMGARGYVLKGMSGRDLARTLRSIQQGELYITPSLAKVLLMAAGEALPEAPTAEAGLRYLTQREADILQLIVQGKINKQIGFELGITEKTVKHYVTNILQKLQVTNRLEAALVAQQSPLFAEPQERRGLP